MKVLVIGGTGFVGRHLVESLVQDGHQVTLFNRGKSAPGLFPGLETLIGDRETSLEMLAGRVWDCAIDTNARAPRAARAAARFLKRSVSHYAFISSISVYEDIQGGVWDEAAPVQRLPPDRVDDTGWETYGARKALCEEWIRDEFPEALIVRPGLVVGPHDPTDRFTYWPVRIAEGGHVLVPESPEAPVRFIDARDLGQWMARLVGNGQTGIFNAARPSVTLGSLLAVCAAVCGTQCHLHWCAADRLAEHGVRPWTDLPLWVPSPVPVDVRRAFAAGLTARPLEEVVRDTLAWARTEGRARPLSAGLSPERERAVLEAMGFL